MNSYNYCKRCGGLIDIAEFGMADVCAECVANTPRTFTRRRWSRARRRYSRWRRTLQLRIWRISHRPWSRMEQMARNFYGEQWGHE